MQDYRMQFDVSLCGDVFIGYFAQGNVKFALKELIERTTIDHVSDPTYHHNKAAIILISSGLAEMMADIALMPLEAIRIRMVADTNYCKVIARLQTNLQST